MKRLRLSPVKSSLDRVFKAVLFATLFVSLNASGAPVSAEQAALMVKEWLLLTPAPLKTPLSGRTIGNVRTFWDQQGQAIYYAVPLQPEGFIITSADTEVEPVIAFSATGSFEANPDFPLFALVQRDLPERLGAVRQQTQLMGANPSTASPKWTRLMQQGTGPQLKATGLDVVDDLRVAPFIQSRWDQSGIWDGSGYYVACYNYYTPPYAAGTGSNYVCGCVSTALAQIMRYFQYPTQSIGTNSFSIDVDGVATTRALRGGDGLGGPYNWSQMPLVPGVGTTEQERQAIGALTADIGAASRTIYRSDGSSASLSDSELKSVFRFANAVWDSGLSSRFAHQVNANLDARLPVYLCLEGDAGHAVVCDGYGYNLSTPYLHLNLGWGGGYDAWYNLPTVGTSYNFNRVSGFYYNIFTNGTGEIISGRVMAGNSVPLFNATVTAICAGGGTYTATTDTNGIYALVKVPSASQYTFTVTKTGFISTNASFSTGTSSSGDCGNIWGADFVLGPVTGPPLIVTQPESQTVNMGSNATFSITVLSQAPLTYQWQCQTGGGSAWSDLSDNGSYSGSQRATLVVLSASITGLEFRCIVTNPSGSVTSSPPAVLTVNFLPLVITTLAGLAGSSGSADGTGSAARFNSPYGVAVDSAGNVFVADYWNHTIRKVTPAGVVATLVGSAGCPLPRGADGTGSAARFNLPWGVTVDSAGNVYVADFLNHTIRKVTPAGVVTTLAGLAGSYGTVDGTGSAARFACPFGVAVDSTGNAYVADTSNHTIRRGFAANVGLTITQQPASQTVNSGANVTLTVVAAGTMPLAYQWKLNGTAISGATSATLTLSSVSSGNAGIYTVDVSNVVGTGTSAGAVLTVLSGPTPAADYQFGNNLASSFKTPPALTLIGSGHSFGVQLVDGAMRSTLSWPAGSGLRLQPTGGVFPNNQYSVVMLVKLTTLGRYRRLLDFKQGSDNGLYAYNDALRFFPTTGASSACLAVETWHQVVFTRSASGQTKVYCDGLLRLSFTDSSGNAIVSGGEVRFFKDDGTENTGGAVCRIRLYASTLTDQEVAALDRGGAVAMPMITAQPESQTVAAGSNAVFAVAATSLTPLSYRWQFDNTNLTGATGARLTLTNVQSSQSGSYRVIVSNAAGSVTSRVATLTVFIALPVVSLVPPSRAVGAGSTVAFDAVVGGSPPFTYQWSFNGSNLLGATNALLVLTNVQLTHAGQYTVVVSNSAGSIPSAPATLVVGAVWLDVSGWEPDGRFRLSVHGDASIACEVWSSTNLTHWTLLGTLTNHTGTVTFTDPVPNLPYRFYQLRQLP